ncbi:MAG: hypothetical protein EHM84_05970, partial [Lysobacterales bacterium]
MKQVISLRDLEEMARHGKDIRSLPEDELLTPSARDFLRDFDSNGSAKVAAANPAASASALKAVTSDSSKS